VWEIGLGTIDGRATVHWITLLKRQFGSGWKRSSSTWQLYWMSETVCASIETCDHLRNRPLAHVEIRAAAENNPASMTLTNISISRRRHIPE
jgi:hypothetical protein